MRPTTMPIETVFSRINAVTGLSTPSPSDLLARFERVPDVWAQLPNWEYLTDHVILKKLTLERLPEGKLLMISEASYQSQSGAFNVDAVDLAAFIQNHQKNFGESFFNGDAFIISLDCRYMWIFHHEGALATFKF